MSVNSLQIPPLISYPIQISHQILRPTTTILCHFSPKNLKKPQNNSNNPITAKSQRTDLSKPKPKTSPPNDDDDGIPADDVKIIAKFKSRHNYIRVLEISRGADHPLAGSRLLLLDAPGNIHSIFFPFKSITNTYFDVLATLPPTLPPEGPLAIFGFGAGSAARLILESYPKIAIHGWELDPAVIAVGRKYFGLDKLEKQFKDRLFIYVGNALNAEIRDGYSGILVDLFSRGSLIPELQDPNTWEMLRKCLRKGGRIMVNVGGSCVEAEDKRRDGKVVMEETLKAMQRVFGNVFLLSLENRKDDSSVALTGHLPDIHKWKMVLPRALRHYPELWSPFSG